jgi:hypothetical protein
MGIKEDIKNNHVVTIHVNAFLNTLKIFPFLVLIALSFWSIFLSTLLADLAHWYTQAYHYIVLLVLIGLIVFIYVYHRHYNYYSVSKSQLIHHKFSKSYSLDLKSVCYIDERWSSKHKTVLLYTSDGHERFYAMDKKGELLLALIDNCHQLLSEDEFYIRFPRVRRSKN